MTDINIGAITESLNYKSDLDLGNTSPQLVDYIVEQQLPSAENNYTWYDLYKSGKVVQGGEILPTTATNADMIITLPITMYDNHYFACSNTTYKGNDAPNYGNVVKSKTTTTIDVGHLANYTTNWRVEGKADLT